MALVLKDRVRDTTATTGTGTITLSGTAPTGYQNFSVIGDGNTTYYAIVGSSEWEVGIGTYTASGTTLSRDVVLESSNSGSLVPFSAGTKQVFVTYPAEKSIADGYGTLPVANGGTGQTTYTNGQLLIGNTTGGTLVKSTLTAGTGISIANGAGSITVTNSAPDQVVAITGAGTTAVTGTYPNFTVTSNDQYVGTVTSVGGTGTVNGITLTGTVTSSGSLTLGGTLSGVSLTTQVSGILPVANGGTNATATPTAGAVSYGTGTAYAFTSAGTAGQVLVSNGSSAPTFGAVNGGTF